MGTRRWSTWTTRASHFAAGRTAPLFDQLVGGSTKEVREADFEHAINPLGGTSAGRSSPAGTSTSRSSPCRPPCRSRSARPCAAWTGATTRCSTPRTRSSRRRSSCGSTARPRSSAGDGIRNSLMSMYVEPLDTYCDMSHLLAVRVLAGPGSTSTTSRTSAASFGRSGGEGPPQAAESVLGHAREFLEKDAGRFWPSVATRPTAPGSTGTASWPLRASRARASVEPVPAGQPPARRALRPHARRARSALACGRANAASRTSCSPVTGRATASTRAASRAR